MNKKLCLALMSIAVIILPFQAQAGQPRLIKTFSKWTAYVFIENDSKVCYMASRSNRATGNYSKRGEEFAIITHRPSEGTKNVFSYIAGYTYKPGSEATVDIDGQVFSLFTQDDAAWAPDAETDEKLTEAIRKGSKMVVKGTSERGTETVDTFSLAGSGGAYDAISKECRL
jgi:invasion protein IalB